MVHVNLFAVVRVLVFEIFLDKITSLFEAMLTWKKVKMDFMLVLLINDER